MHAHACTHISPPPPPPPPTHTHTHMHKCIGGQVVTWIENTLDFHFHGLVLKVLDGILMIGYKKLSSKKKNMGCFCCKNILSISLLKAL